MYVKHLWFDCVRCYDRRGEELALRFWALTASLSGSSAQVKPRLQRGGSSASLHNSLMRNSIFQLMIHTLDPLAEGKHQALVWGLVWGRGKGCEQASVHKTCLCFRHKPANVLVCLLCQRQPQPFPVLFLPLPSSPSEILVPGTGAEVRLLILSFDASSIKTVCYQAEQTKELFLSLPAGMTVLFHHPPQFQNEVVYQDNLINCVSLKKRERQELHD